jgi:oxygen-dependent protoporphyrinogen oxidase
MLGKLDPSQREVTVVGAGIAGLLAAYQLDRAGYSVTVLEASARAGGMIETHQHALGIAEAAAHSIQATPAVLDLCKELGVELVEVRRESRARYIWRQGRLRRFPLSVGEALRAFFRAYFVLADPKRAPDRLTLEQWARHHLGEAPLKYLMTPFVRGIYGASSSEIQLGMAFPGLAVPIGHSLLSLQLRRLFLRLLGKAPAKARRPVMMAPRGGMGALVAALEARVKSRLGARFRIGARVTELPRESGNLLLCVPAEQAARFFVETVPELSVALDSIPYSPLISITAFVEKRSFGSPPCGVGVLLPEGTSRKVLGVLFNSSSFPGRVTDEGEWVSLTAMLGGSQRPEIFQAGDAELEAVVRSDLEALLDLAPGARIKTVIHRWERAIPQYGESLRAAWASAQGSWCAQPGQILFGNYTGQVSIRGMVDLAARLHSSTT